MSSLFLGSFAENCLFSWALLQKRRILLRSLLIVATPYASSVITEDAYGVATISRLLKIIRLFCKRAQEKRQFSAIETYVFKEPTKRSHPIT